MESPRCIGCAGPLPTLPRACSLLEEKTLHVYQSAPAQKFQTAFVSIFTSAADDLPCRRPSGREAVRMTSSIMWNLVGASGPNHFHTGWQTATVRLCRCLLSRYRLVCQLHADVGRTVERPLRGEPGHLGDGAAGPKPRIFFSGQVANQSSSMNAYLRHVTQFTKIGWRYLANGSGSGELPRGGYYTAWVDPSSDDFTMNFVKISRGGPDLLWSLQAFFRKPQWPQLHQAILWLRRPRLLHSAPATELPGRGGCRARAPKFTLWCMESSTPDSDLRKP